MSGLVGFFLIAVKQQYPISKYEFLHLWGNFAHDVWMVYKAMVLFFSFFCVPNYQSTCFIMYISTSEFSLLDSNLELYLFIYLFNKIIVM